MSVLGFAFFVNLGIMFLRARFVWCPLHPAGYVIGLAPGTTDMIWFPVAIAMTTKWLLIRHGGIKAYRAAIPFFVGLGARRSGDGLLLAHPESHPHLLRV